jgi:hypothetical protein
LNVNVPGVAPRFLLKTADQPSIVPEVANVKRGWKRMQVASTLENWLKTKKEQPRTVTVNQVNRLLIREDVYCMSVPDTECFALENGAIAHNCRYGYMMRRYAIRKGDLNIKQKVHIPRALGR